MPKSVKYLRALVIVIAVFLGTATQTRLAVIGQFGPNPGIPSTVGNAVVAIAGYGFALFLVGLFFLLGRPARRHWWLTWCLPLLALVNFVAALVVVPEEHYTAATVLDIFVVNGLLPLLLIGLLLKRSVRAYFGISRPAARANAA